MNYSEKIKYNIYTTTEKASFSQMIDKLLMQIENSETVLRLVFFSAVNNKEEYIKGKKEVFDKVEAKFGNNMPALTFVSEPPLDSQMTLEVHSFMPDLNDTITYRSMESVPYVLLENSMARFLFAGGFHGDLANMSIQEQSVDVFRQLNLLLREEGFSINEIVRQWNYIEQITKYEGDNQHYQLFNNERSSFYLQTEWDKGYPAATGIGADSGGILVDIDVISLKTPDAFVASIDNKLQIAAHSYSGNVLENANNLRSTPKFERAKSVTFNDHSLIYISGTAAIRGEDSLEEVGLEKQLHITMENIAELTGNAELKLLRVYLKHPKDYEEAARLMDTYKLSIPISYMCADVCRDELLIEIEGIAIN